jgi:O-antigen ligase
MLIGILYYYLIYLGRGYVGVWFRGDVGEGGKNTLAYVISLFFPLMMAHVLLARSQKKVKLAEWAFAGVYALALLFSTSRGTYVAAAFTLVFLLAYLVGRPRRRLVFIVGLAVLLLMLYQPTRVLLHLRSLRDILVLGLREAGRSEGSIPTRIRLMEEAWDSFRRSPVWGFGLGSFSTLASRPSHNDYLRVMAEMGMIGILAYMSLLLVHLIGLAKLLWIQRQSPGWLEVGLLGMMLSMAIRLVFFNGDTFYVTWVVLGLVSSLLLSQRARPSTDQED